MDPTKKFGGFLSREELLKKSVQASKKMVRESGILKRDDDVDSTDGDRAADEGDGAHSSLNARSRQQAVTRGGQARQHALVPEDVNGEGHSAPASPRPGEEEDVKASHDVTPGSSFPPDVPSAAACTACSSDMSQDTGAGAVSLKDMKGSIGSTSNRRPPDLERSHSTLSNASAGVSARAMFEVRVCVLLTHDQLSHWCQSR